MIPKIDDPALDARAEERLLLYRRARLAEDPCAPRGATEERGFTDNDIVRIHAPIGLESVRCRPPKSPSRSSARSRKRLREGRPA